MPLPTKPQVVDEAFILEVPVVDRSASRARRSSGGMPAAINAPTIAPADVPGIRWNV